MKKKKILIIEDDRDLIEMYAMRLEQAGFEVERAENGVWGLEVAKKIKFDIIVMDMSMPAMNGDEMLLKIRGDSENKNSFIIVLSGSAQDDDFKNAKENGASRCLLKSQVTPTGLLEEIEGIIKFKV